MPNPQKFGGRHVDAGVDVNGYQIFVAQVNHNGGVHPARANTGASGMFDFLDVGVVWPPEAHRLQVPTSLTVTTSWRFRCVAHRNITLSIDW